MRKAPVAKANYTEGPTPGPIACASHAPATDSQGERPTGPPYTSRILRVRVLSMPRLTLLLVLALLGSLLGGNAFAQWKWRDKAGVVQYSDLPPPNGTADKDVLQRPTTTQQRRAAAAAAIPASGASAAAAPRLPKGIEPELETKRRKAEQELAAKSKAEEDKSAATRADNCTRAKAYARTLDEGMRLSRTNAKGEREIIDDGNRAEEVKRAKSVIASDCK